MSNVQRVAHPVSLQQAVLRFKRHMIELALLRYSGNRTRAAEALGVPRAYLHTLIRKLGVCS